MTNGDSQALHEGIIALLGVIVTASIFTLGFLSHRTHAALRDAQHHLETGGGAKARRMAHADRLLHATRSWFVLLVNLALGLGLIAVIVEFTETAGIGRQGETTLWGFALVEAAVLALAFYDRYVVVHEFKVAKDAAPADEQGSQPGSDCEGGAGRCPPGPPKT